MKWNEVNENRTITLIPREGSSIRGTPGLSHCFANGAAAIQEKKKTDRFYCHSVLTFPIQEN